MLELNNWIGGVIVRELVERAQEVLKRNHLRWTKQRKMMIMAVADDPTRYIDITGVDQYLRQDYPGLSHNTIYRNFKEFEELGIVELRQHNDQMQVKYCCDSVHHHHFICDRCGRVQEIKMMPIDDAFFEKQLPGIKITGHSFELHGICARCRAKELNKK